MLKDFLKRILPLPASTTNRRMDQLLEQLQAIREEHLRLEASLRELERRQADVARQQQQQQQQQQQHLAGQLQALGEENQRRISDTFNLLNVIDFKLEQFQGKWLEDVLVRDEPIENSYKHQYLRRMRSLLPIMELDGQGKFARFGRDGDGGYIMLDDFPDSGIAYSFGINDDVSWDKDMASHGWDVYMYDHTIDGLPEENPRFHWSKLGLAGRYDEGEPALQTLPVLLEENRHTAQRDMILKVDIEGAEWEFLAEIPPEVLRQFRQIVIEYHDLLDMEKEPLITSALRKINETHQMVHIHSNNWNDYLLVGGKILPDILECTYLNRDRYAFRPSCQFFPTPLDQPNYAQRPDFVLGSWGQVEK